MTQLRYEELLRAAGLPDIPFHMGPLLNGHGLPSRDSACHHATPAIGGFGLRIGHLVGEKQVDTHVGTMPPTGFPPQNRWNVTSRPVKL